MALLVSLLACTPPPVVTTYVLDARISERPVARPAGGVLLVTEPRAEPGFDTARIAYLRTPHALAYYTQSSWVDTPARMLLPLLVNAMEGSRTFNAVLATPTGASGDLRLETSLIRLQQEFLEQPSKVRLTVRVKLIDPASRHVLATQLFEVVEPAPTEDAYGGVQAANRAVQQLLEQVREFVVRNATARTLRRPVAGPPTAIVPTGAATNPTARTAPVAKLEPRGSRGTAASGNRAGR